MFHVKQLDAGLMTGIFYINVSRETFINQFKIHRKFFD